MIVHGLDDSWGGLHFGSPPGLKKKKTLVGWSWLCDWWHVNEEKIDENNDFDITLATVYKSNA